MPRGSSSSSSPSSRDAVGRSGRDAPCVLVGGRRRGAGRRVRVDDGAFETTTTRSSDDGVGARVCVSSDYLTYSFTVRSNPPVNNPSPHRSNDVILDAVNVPALLSILLFNAKSLPE